MAPIPTYVPPSGLHTPMDDFRKLVNGKYDLRLGKYNPVLFRSHLHQLPAFVDSMSGQL